MTPSGLQNGLEDVLIVIEGVHAPIPDSTVTSQPVHLQEGPEGETSAVPSSPQPPSLTTDADRLVEQYRKIGEAEKHVYGQSAGGAPNFNIHLDPSPAAAPPTPPAGVGPSPASATPPPASATPKPATKNP